MNRPKLRLWNGKLTISRPARSPSRPWLDDNHYEWTNVKIVETHQCPVCLKDVIGQCWYSCCLMQAAHLECVYAAETGLMIF
jgi:hypothetical protein